MKKTLLPAGLLLLSVLFGAQVMNAIGTLTPSGTPGDDTQYTLNDIYDKLADFSDTPTATSSPFTIFGPVSASFRTLNEIYGLLESEVNDLVAGNIADGVEIFGIEGELEGAPAPLTWQPGDGISLCWDASEICPDGGLLDLIGDGSLLLSANEYCDYLQPDGTTVATTPQNYWHLPTIQEYNDITDFTQVNLATDVAGFDDMTGYWSSTQYEDGGDGGSGGGGGTEFAWLWASSDGSIDMVSKINAYIVRCAH